MNWKQNELQVLTGWQTVAKQPVKNRNHHPLDENRKQTIEA